MQSFADLPILGVGIGFRPELESAQKPYLDRIDWFELIADRYMRAVPESIDRAHALLESHPLVPHGLEMSIGSDEPLNVPYCEQASELVRAVRAPFYSDHLCMTRVQGLELGQLTPIPFTEVTASRCAAKAREAQRVLGVPFLLENIAYPFALPGHLSEAEFIARVVDEADCGVLLDLANVFINAQNHRYDPYAFLEALPLERVVQVHLAGGERQGDRWVDSHSQSVSAHPEVWKLLEHVVARSPVRAILIERDHRFPSDFEEIIEDVERARAILRSAHRATPRPAEAYVAPRRIVSSPVDTLAFQLALTRVLVEPAIGRAFASEPYATARALGLDAEGACALAAAGAPDIARFARDLFAKRISLLSKSVPATFRLLEREGRLGEIARRFVEENAPRQTPEHASRTARDAHAFLMLVDRVIAEMSAPSQWADVVRFDRCELELCGSAAMVESSKSFAHSQRPVSFDALRSARPRLGPHARLERFTCDVVSLARRLTGDEQIDVVPNEPTTVLFSKAPGYRNVHHLALSPRAADLVSLCDGSRTTLELAEAVFPHRAHDRIREVARIVSMLCELNAVRLDPEILSATTCN